MVETSSRSQLVRKRFLGMSMTGFWADIGTIRSFYEINLEIASKNPPFSLIDEGWPIYTHPRYLPGSLIEECILRETLIAEGSWIQKAEISESIIGLTKSDQKGNKN